MKSLLKIIRADAFVWIPKFLASNSIPLICTDPPYSKILKHDWDQNWTIDDQWKMTSLIEDVLVPGGTAYVWGGIGTPKNRLFFEWLSKIETYSGLTLYNLITWKKKRAYGKKDDYLFTREECVMLVKGKKPRTFNIPLLEEKRAYAGFNVKYPAKSEHYRRTNVWNDITELLRGKIHDAEKPVRLAEVMIETSSNPDELVLDFLAGSGNVGLAAQKLGRPCILIEKSDCQMRVDG